MPLGGFLPIARRAISMSGRVSFSACGGAEGSSPPLRRGMSLPYEELALIASPLVAHTVRRYKSEPISRTISAAIQARRHWPRTTCQAQRRPSSRRMEAMAATQGV